jgi:ribosomal protein L31E
MAAATRLAAHRIAQFENQFLNQLNELQRQVTTHHPVRLSFPSISRLNLWYQVLTALRNVVKDQEARRQGSTICHRRRCRARVHHSPPQESTLNRDRMRLAGARKLIRLYSSTASHSRSGHQEPSRRSRSSQRSQWYVGRDSTEDEEPPRNRQQMRKCWRIEKLTMLFQGTSDVRLDPQLNKKVWEAGIKGVPYRLRIRISRKRNDEEGAKVCALFHTKFTFWGDRAESRSLTQELPKELAVMQAPETAAWLSLGSRASPFLHY